MLVRTSASFFRNSLITQFTLFCVFSYHPLAIMPAMKRPAIASLAHSVAEEIQCDADLADELFNGSSSAAFAPSPGEIADEPCAAAPVVVTEASKMVGEHCEDSRRS